MGVTARGNFDGLYPPVFYAVMSALASPNLDASAIAMRLLNGLLFIGLNAILFRLLPQVRRTTLVWAWVISLLPLGIFLIASNNPSSWAVISAGTLWIALVGYFESSGRTKVGLAIIAAIAALMGAGSRGDSAMYAVLAAFVAMVLTAERSRRFWVSACLPLALSVMSLLFYFSADQTSDAAGGLGSGHGGFALLITNLTNMPLLWAGAFGSWGLGWLDTPLHGIVSVGALTCFAAVAFSGLARTSWRKTVSLLAIALALWTVPAYVLVQSNAVIGEYVQPRYILPLLIMFGGIALLDVGKEPVAFSAIQRWSVVATLTVANALALHVNIRRYTSGLDVGGWNLNSVIEWWWPIPISPMFVWVLGAVSFAVALTVTIRMVAPRPSGAEDLVASRERRLTDFHIIR